CPVARRSPRPSSAPPAFRRAEPTRPRRAPRRPRSRTGRRRSPLVSPNRAQEDGKVVADALQRSHFDALSGGRVEQGQRVLAGPECVSDAEAAPVRAVAEGEGVSAAKVHLPDGGRARGGPLDPSRSVRGGRTTWTLSARHAGPSPRVPH